MIILGRLRWGQATALFALSRSVLASVPAASVYTVIAGLVGRTHLILTHDRCRGGLIDGAPLAIVADFALLRVLLVSGPGVTFVDDFIRATMAAATIMAIGTAVGAVPAVGAPATV